VTRSGTSDRRLAVAFVVVAVTLAACGPSTATPTPPPSPIGTPAASPSPSAGQDLAIVDRALLDYLPADVDGVAIEVSPETEDALRSDPLLAEVSVGYAAAFAVAADEWVVALVVRMRPGLLDDARYRDWRETFDAGVCEQAGGVSRTAETEIGGRAVYVATCAGGVRTYHVMLESDAVLISAQAVGERRLGERLVENLRP